MRTSTTTRVSEQVVQVTERSTDLHFYIREFNILVRRPSLSPRHSRHKSLSRAHTHTYAILSTSLFLELFEPYTSLDFRGHENLFSYLSTN